MNLSNPNDMSGSMPDAGFGWPSEHDPVISLESDMSLVLDLPVYVKVIWGRTKQTFRQLSQMADGFVMELDSDSGQPVDLMVNGCLVARGEIVILNNRFGIRVTDIISNSERFAKKKL
jgi:flagellar motor switch protein FliN/FliY